jgi:hypothetical protein
MILLRSIDDELTCGFTLPCFHTRLMFFNELLKLLTLRQKFFPDPISHS